MAHFRDRYGIPAQEIENLYSRFKQQGLCKGFGSFDKFLRFVSESGYECGMLMRKKDDSKPHSPDNTVFCTRGISLPPKRKPRPKKTAEEQKPCIGCREICLAACEYGCVRWKKWFVSNWNKNIYRRAKATDKKRMVFCYEHPDLVREGIVFGKAQEK